MHDRITTTRQAGWPQGLVLLFSSAFPVMGVVLLSAIAPRLPAAVGTGPGGIELAPIVMTAPALAIAICSPFAGFLLDLAGRRICFLGALFVYAALGTAPLWLENPYLIIAARFGLGIAEAMILTANLALIGDYFSGSTRDRWIAINMAVAAFSATLFYILGGLLGSISWRAPFASYGASIVLFIAAVPLIFEPAASADARKPAATAPEENYNSLISTPIIGLATIFALTFAGSILFYIVPLQLGWFLEARGVKSAATIGLLIAIAGLGNPLGSFSFRFLRAFPLGPVFCASMFLSGLGLLVAAAWHSVPSLIAGAFINQLGCGMLCPLTQSAILRLAPPHRRGASGGGWATSFFSGQFFSPLVVLPVMAMDHASGGLVPLGIGYLIYAAACLVLFPRAASLSGARAADAIAQRHEAIA